jgi:hypothetical protein
MTDYGTIAQPEETDRLLTAFIDTFHSSFASGQPFPWIELWAEDAEMARLRACTPIVWTK